MKKPYLKSFQIDSFWLFMDNATNFLSKRKKDFLTNVILISENSLPRNLVSAIFER